MIRYCPNCSSELHENKKLAQGVRECPECSGRFFILETTIGQPCPGKYTGLTDKDNEKIFLNSSVKFYYKGQYVTCKITFTEGMFCLLWPDGYVNKYMLNNKNYKVVK